MKPWKDKSTGLDTRTAAVVQTKPDDEKPPMHEWKDKFRYLKYGEDPNLGRLLKTGESILDPDFMLSLHHEAVAAEKEFDQERTRIAELTSVLIKKAEELGGKVSGVDFEGTNPIPSEKRMEWVIKMLRKAYLVALFAKNFHLFVEMADRGEKGMVHVRRDVKRIGSNDWRKWEYMVREDYITLPCKEKVTDKCLYIQDDMDVLEWNAPGHDRDGNYSKTGFPSKWNTHIWRLPRSVKVLASTVWKGAKLKVNPYNDFRDLFWSSMCCGGGNGKGEYWHSIYPRVWDIFGLNSNEWQYKYPFRRIRWDDRVNVTKIVFELLENERQLTDAKDIK